MDIDIIQSAPNTHITHNNTLSMVIKSFKGRRDVEVHLFRGQWEASDETNENWDTLIASGNRTAQSDSRRMIMEAFSDAERDLIVNYLKEQYSTRLTAIRSRPLSFPVPAGIPGLSQVNPDKNIGFIEFLKIPSYPLDIALKGLYDLSKHPPIVNE